MKNDGTGFRKHNSNVHTIIVIVTVVIIRKATTNAHSDAAACENGIEKPAAACEKRVCSGGTRKQCFDNNSAVFLVPGRQQPFQKQFDQQPTKQQQHNEQQF